MFTGLVSDVGTIAMAGEGQALRRFRIRSAYDPAGIGLGASIACGGPCLTVVAIESCESGCFFDVEVGAETLARTNAGQWRPGTRLNLERSLRIGDEMGGHLVTGHVDATATILAVEPFDGMIRFGVEVPQALSPLVAEKGSVALDGTSLTVNSVGSDSLSVLLIPHTLAVTTWGDRSVGDRVNIEVDLMARYAARLVQAGGSPYSNNSKI